MNTLIKIKQNTSLSVEFIAFISKYAQSTQSDVTSSLNHFTTFLFKMRLDPRQITQQTVWMYQNYLRESNITSDTFNKKSAHIKALLKHLGKDFVFKTIPSAPYENLRLINERSFKNMIHHIKENYHKSDGKKQHLYLRNWILLKLYFLTALRNTELRSLRHNSIELEAGQYFYKTKIKGGREIKKDLPYDIIHYIHQLQGIEKKSDGDYIFTSKKGGAQKMIDSKTVRRMLKANYSKFSSGEKVTVHGIRNISGLAVLEETKDIFAAKEQLNHSHINTTQLYIEKAKREKSTFYDVLMTRMMN